MNSWARFLLLFLVLLTACSQSSPAADDSDATSSGKNLDGLDMKAMSNQELVTFLNSRFLPFAESTVEQMEALPSDQKTVIDIGLQDVIKQTKALIKQTREQIAGKAFDKPEQVREHLIMQNQALMKLKMASVSSIFQGYIYLGEKDILPVQSLKSWHEMQVGFNRRLLTNYQQLIKLATEAPAGQAAPANTPPTEKPGDAEK